MLNKNDYRRYYNPREWKSFYESLWVDEVEILNDGRKVINKNRRSNIQKIIVKSLVSRLYSQQIKVESDIDGIWKYNRLNINNEFIDIKALITSPLAYGEILVDIVDDFPKIILNYKKEYTDGSLTKASYKYKTKNENGREVQKEVKQYIDMETGYVYISDTVEGMEDDYILQPYVDYLRCFIIECDNKIGDFADPIYADAINQIREFDEVYAEMPIDRNISRKSVLLPKQMEEGNREAMKANGKTVVRSDRDSRLYRQWDINSDVHQQPVFINGGYQPIPYISEAEIHLSLIGWNSGVGNNFLTFDKSGGIKTATEIESNDAQLKITELNIQHMFRDLIIKLLLRYDVVVKDVIFKNNEVERIDVRDSRLMNEYRSGLITKEAYHKSRGLEDMSIIPVDVLDDGEGDTNE